MNEELSEETVNIINSSAELLATRSTDITTRMYEILFSKYPQLKELFKDQPENQYMILADALSLFAVNIAQLDTLEPALNKIARTHVKVNVKPIHYPMVGMSLLEAMRDVLGDEVPIAFYDAWREVYKYLGLVLVDMEEKLYLSKVDNN